MEFCMEFVKNRPKNAIWNPDTDFGFFVAYSGTTFLTRRGDWFRGIWDPFATGLSFMRAPTVPFVDRRRPCEISPRPEWDCSLPSPLGIQLQQRNIWHKRAPFDALSLAFPSTRRTEARAACVVFRLVCTACVITAITHMTKPKNILLDIFVN